MFGFRIYLSELTVQVSYVLQYLLSDAVCCEILIRFQATWLGFAHLLASVEKLIISTEIPGIKSICSVTPSLQKYLLTDFKPHVSDLLFLP